MNHLSSTLVLCDLDHLLLGADGNLTQVVRDVLQLFVRRGGRTAAAHPLERHLRQEWTPYLLANAADIKGEEVLRVLLYQDSKAVPMISLLEKSLGDRTAVLLGERAAADTLILTPRTVSGREMLDAVCMPVGIDPEDVLVLAGGLPMLDMVRASSQSTAAADAPAELRLAAQKVTLTDAAAGSAVEVLYRMVRDAENLA